MKVAIASDWFAPRRGGIEAQLLQLAERLGARGNDVDVLTSMRDARDGSAFRVRRLDVMTMPRLDFAISPALLVELRRELSRGYDVVHAHVSVVSPVGWAAVIVARSLNLPAVVTFHSVLRAKAYVLRALNAVGDFARGATLWSAVSELVAEQVRRALGGVEVKLLPNGIDLELWRASGRVGSHPRNADIVTLVTAIRLHRKKRPRELLHAFARAAARTNVRSRLMIVGDGPEHDVIAADIRELGLHTGDVRAELMGWMEPVALRALYAEADGFVLAAMRESFGIAALEARAAGLPVIAMKAAGSGEFLEHEVNALVCEDDAALVASISRFLSDAPLRARLRAGPSDLARYDWSAVLLEHERAYGEAMRRVLLAAGAAAASV